MKRMLFLGALVLGVTVCSQSFGFEILDRMLGCKKGGTSCTEPSCGAGNGCADACEPGCGAGNGCLGGCGAEPGCAAGNGCAEPACDAGNGCTDGGCTAAPKCRKKHSLFGGLKGLFDGCKRKHSSCTSASCCGAEPACDAGNGCLGGWCRARLCGWQRLRLRCGARMCGRQRLCGTGLRCRQRLC